jgi:hypothetical protein
MTDWWNMIIIDSVAIIHTLTCTCTHTNTQTNTHAHTHMYITHRLTLTITITPPLKHAHTHTHTEGQSDNNPRGDRVRQIIQTAYYPARRRGGEGGAVPHDGMYVRFIVFDGWCTYE